MTVLLLPLKIQPYVNGALYSILSIPSIREEARAMVRDVRVSASASATGQEPSARASQTGPKLCTKSTFAVSDETLWLL